MTGPEPLALDAVVFARGLRTADGSRPALSGIDLDILPGEIFAIVGRGGSGKTALLEGLVGLRPLAADVLMVCGSDPRRFPLVVKHRIGVAPQRVAVERAMTVEEAVELFAALYERPGRCAPVLETLNLLACRHEYVDRLPPDAQQRCSLALALLNDPVVLFADEVTRDLQPESARQVWDLLVDRRRRGRTAVITTNRLEEAERLADRVAVLDGGRLLALDTPGALLARHAGAVRIAFDLPRPPIDLEALRALDGAHDAVRTGDTYVVWSTDGFATMRGVIRLLDQAQARPRSLDLRHPTLEDAFFQLTGRTS